MPTGFVLAVDSMRLTFADRYAALLCCRCRVYSEPLVPWCSR